MLNIDGRHMKVGDDMLYVDDDDVEVRKGVMEELPIIDTRTAVGRF